MRDLEMQVRNNTHLAWKEIYRIKSMGTNLSGPQSAWSDPNILNKFEFLKDENYSRTNSMCVFLGVFWKKKLV